MTLDGNASGNNQVHVTSLTAFAFDGTDDSIDNPVTWTPSVTWQGDEDTWKNYKDYLQMGTGDKPVASFTLRTDDFGGKTIKSVTVTCCYTSYNNASNKPTLTITAGDTAMLSAATMTKTDLTPMTSTTSNVTLGASDTLTIQINSSVGAGIRISAVTVVYETPQP